LSARLSREHGVKAVPVFWIDAEDHDWDEIAGCGVLASDQTLRRVQVRPPDGAGERTVASLRYTDAIVGALEELTATLPSTDFTGELLDALRDAYQPGRGVAEAFGRFIDRVLGPHGLVVYDASDPAAKPFAAPIFLRELERPGQTSSLAAASGANLVALGYHMQVTPHESSAALFDLQGGRKAIRAAADGFLIGEEPVSREALIERARLQPETFSPTYCCVQLCRTRYFPRCVTWRVPNELAYLGQLRGVYDAFGVPMPLMQPRATATVLDSAGVRFLTRYKVPLAALEAQDEHALNELLRAQLPPTVEKSMQEAEAEIAARMEDRDTRGAGHRSHTRGRRALDAGQAAARPQEPQRQDPSGGQRRDETLRRQFQHVRAQAFPGRGAAGARRRVRLIPQQVRPRVRRTPGV
jgi:uncharacterized protein YllA (UPF0747 family)